MNYIFLALLMIGFAGSGLAADVLSGLKPVHPRLLVASSTWNDLRARRVDDRTLDLFLNRLAAEGRSTLDSPPLVYEKKGKRLLEVSRSAFQRIVLWSFDYRLTGEERFLHRADEEMQAMAAFSDWNPAHFLDTAEMTAAMSLGYDWLYNDLPPASRQIICRAIIEKGLRPGLDARFTNWYFMRDNWNEVCFGGMTLGALAVAESDPAISRRMLALAKRDNQNGLEPYRPDGIYPEGPNYWSYGTTYEVMMIAALQSALGTDWNLSQSRGFLASADYYLQMTGPTRMMFNYSDGGPKSEYLVQPALFWMAQRLSRPELLYFQQDGLNAFLGGDKFAGTIQFLPLAALWWPTDPQPVAPSLPLAWTGRGINPLSVMRSSWTNGNALYLAVKGGTASANHGHMDAGSFILEAGGVRWAVDLGAQDYNSLESKGIDLWGMNQNSGRWKVFRLNNFSHNTLTIAGRLHNVKGRAPLSQLQTNGSATGVTVDLTQIFAGQANRVTRTFELVDNREVNVQDDLQGLHPGDVVRWAMVTPAEVELDGQRAVLRLDGKQLGASETCSVDSDFEVIPADPPNDGYNAPNPGISVLIIRARTPESGRLHISVTLRPD